MEIRYEPQQEGHLHPSVKQALINASWGADLDAAEQILRNAVNPERWLVGRGGHHVWLAWRNGAANFGYPPVRVAMIVEVA